MSDLSNLIRREASYGDGARAHHRIAKVTSYNPETHAVKAMLQPEGVETGWIPLGSAHIGNGFGLAIGANKDDQIVLGFVDGDHNTPIVVSRIFSDTHKAPKVKSGEMVLHHESGTNHRFSADGSHTQTHATKGTITWDKDGNHTTDNGNKSIATKAGNVSTAANQVSTKAAKAISQQAGKIFLNCG